jgi:hypothetical protein
LKREAAAGSRLVAEQFDFIQAFALSHRPINAVKDLQVKNYTDSPIRPSQSDWFFCTPGKRQCNLAVYSCR